METFQNVVNKVGLPVGLILLTTGGVLSIMGRGETDVETRDGSDLVVQILLCVGALMITLVYGLNFNYLNYGTCKKVAAAVAVAAAKPAPMIRQAGVTTLSVSPAVSPAVSPLVSSFGKKW